MLFRSDLELRDGVRDGSLRRPVPRVKALRDVALEREAERQQTSLGPARERLQKLTCTKMLPGATPVLLQVNVSAVLTLARRPRWAG